MPTIEERVTALENKLTILEDILFSLGRALKLGSAPVEQNWTGRPGGTIDPGTLDAILFTVGSYLADKSLDERVALGRGTNCPPICPVPGGIPQVEVAARRVVKKPKR